MLNIAVVDDDEFVLIEAEKIINRYAQLRRTPAVLHCFTDGDELLKLSPLPELVFLDIELPLVNGIETGLRLRSTEGGGGCQIVYISSRTHYAMQLFQVHPFDFIVKPLTEERLHSCLDEYLRLFPQDRLLSIKQRTETLDIPVGDIVYLESSSRKVIVHCTDTEYSFYGRLQKTAADEALTGFVLIHQSFLVNLSHIQTYSYETLTVTGGAELSISKPNRSEVRRRLLEYRADRSRRR